MSITITQHWAPARAASHLGMRYAWENYVIQSSLDDAHRQRNDLFDVFKDDTGRAVYRASSLSEAQLWVAFEVASHTMAAALRNASAVIGLLDDQISQMEGMFSDEDGQIAEAREEAEETCTQIEAMLKHHKAGEPLPVPEIYITMDGGLIEDVYSTGSLVGASYTVIDYDVEGAEDVQFIERADGTVTEACIGGGTVGLFTSTITETED